MSNQYLFFITAIACIIQCFFTIFVFVGKNEKNNKIRLLYAFMTMYSIVNIVALFVKDYFAESLLQSIANSFVIISVVVNLRFFVNEVYGNSVYKFSKKITMTFLILTAIDVIMQFINIFYEFLLSYSYDDNRSVYWLRNIQPGFWYHIILVYLAIIAAMIIVILKCKSISSMYARGYMIVLFTAIGLGIINVIFEAFNYNQYINFLPILFCIYMVVLYRVMYFYVDGPMLDHIGFYAINEYINPVIMFDYQDKMIVSNREFKKLSERVIKYRKKEEFAKYFKYKNYSLADFKRDFFIDVDSFEEDKFFNISFMEGRTVLSYRVDYTNVSDSNSKEVGKMFIFTDTTQEIDILTGFHKRETFNKYFETAHPEFSYPAGVILIDIKGLKKYNEEHGKENGNRIIQLVAMNMMRYCPNGSYYFRGQEADLYAICPGADEAAIKEIIANIGKALGQDDSNNKVVTIRSTYGLINSDVQSVIQVADTITVNMKTKKMIDIDADRSSILDSLIQMQKESDPLLSRHIKRTRYLAELMADKLGMSDHQTNNLTLLALIHDIGNIGVPMEIVNKPGRLTNIEWEIMKSHVTKGYRIAHASAEFKDVALCVLHHHECFDGTGYPDGLSGESIPYLARVIAVIEAYDAMTNERPYRTPMSVSEARNELIKCKGKQYDPKVVDTFIELIAEIAPVNKEENKTSGSEMHKLAPMSIAEDSSKHGYVEQVNHSTYILDHEDKIIEVDDAFENITGYTREDIEKHQMSQKSLIFDADWDYYMTQVNQYIETFGEVYLEHRIKCKDGSGKYVFCYGRRYYDNVAKAGRSTIVITDISESKKNFIGDVVKIQNINTAPDIYDSSMINMQRKEYAEDEYSIEYRGNDDEVDSLTGLMTLKLFDRLNERLFANTEESLLFMLIDIDNFEGFSKQNGKDEACKLLSYFGNALVQTISNEGITARINLDTFACTLTLLSDGNESLAKAKVAEVWGSLMDTINEEYRGTTLSIGAAFGAIDKEGKRDYKVVCQNAKLALEKVKAEGRNGYKIL